MASAISLVFLGGIADSGKTALAESLAQNSEVRAEKISRFFRDAMPVLRKGNGDQGRPALIYADWKSTGEEGAIDKLCNDIGTWRRERLKTLIINTHFATYSPGGYMMGLDPISLQRICKACNLIDDESKTKAAVILVDISFSDVLQWRARHPTVDLSGSVSVEAIARDLEFNRLYALQYYTALVGLIGSQQVLFYRCLIDHQGSGSLDTSLPNTNAFKVAKEGARSFLKTSGML